MSKEKATIILVRTVGHNCTKIERKKAGVPPYHLNKYGAKQVVGILLCKHRYNLKLLNDNEILLKLPAPDVQVVLNYSKDESKKNYFAHHVLKSHWLKEEEIIKDIKIKSQNHQYLSKNHALVSELRKKIFAFLKYESDYDVTYVIAPFFDRYILSLQGRSKWFEFRRKLNGTTEQNARHLKALVGNVNINKSQIKESKKSKKKKFQKIYKLKDYLQGIAKNIHSLIVEKSEANPNYNPLTDPEISHYTNFLQQWNVDRLKLFNAKPLYFKTDDYKALKYHQLYQKPWKELKAEYCPAEAAATS